MGSYQANAPEQAAGRATGERPARPQWHLLGLAIWGTVARPAERARSLHHLLQPLRSLASGRRLEPDHECTSWGSRCCCADDRHVYCSRASAWGMHHTEPKAVDGAVTRWIDQQDSCAGRYQWPAGPARADGR